MSSAEMAAVKSATTAAAVPPPPPAVSTVEKIGTGGRQFCLDLCEMLMLGQGDEQSDVCSRVLSYLTYIEGLQLSGGEGDDKVLSERLSSASAIFLALYEQPELSPVPGRSDGGGCRLGELLRQSNIGVKDFMEYLSLLAGRLPQPLSGQLQADLRVMKEGIVVTKMLYGKYRQLWNERNSLARSITPTSKASTASANGSMPGGALGSSGGTSASGHDWFGDFESLSPPCDPEALPRLGWYLYLFTKDVLGFRSSNAAFVKCLQVLLASLGVVIWNASLAGQRSACCTPTSADQQKAVELNGSKEGAPAQTALDSAGGSIQGQGGSRTVQEGKSAAADSGSEFHSTAGGAPVEARAELAPASGAEGSRQRAASGDSAASQGSKGAYGGEKGLLAALSKSGRCSAEEVRAMSARVIEVIEALLEEGIVVSNSNCPSPHFGTENPGDVGGTVEADSTVIPTAAGTTAVESGGSSAMEVDAGGSKSRAHEDGKQEETDQPEAGSIGKVEDAGGRVMEPPGAEAGRAGRVAGMFHPSVVADNTARLDAYYWVRVSERGAEGEGGGIRVLDEAFVLTSSLRDTVGTPRCGTSTPRRPAITPSVSRASRQLFQDYQKVSHSGGGSSAPSPASDIGGIGLSFGSGFPDTPSSSGVSQGNAAASGGRVGGAAGYLLESPLPRSGFTRGGGARGVRGSPIVVRPPATPVMAAMETVRWIAGLDSMRKGPQESLLRKLEKCETVSPSLIQERLATLMAKLDGPANDRQVPSRQKHQSAGGMPFAVPGQAPGGGAASVELGVLAEAKGKAEALYYVTLEALLDAETKRLGSEDHSRLLLQSTLHGAILACCLEAVLKASSLLSLTFPWVLRRMGIDALDLCKVLESFARFCPALPMNLKYHLFEVQTEIVERLALEDGAGVFRLIAEHKAAGAWPVPALKETDVAPPTGSRLAGLNSTTTPPTSTTPRSKKPPSTGASAAPSCDSDTPSRGNAEDAAPPPAVQEGADASGVTSESAKPPAEEVEIVKVAPPVVTPEQAAAAQAGRARASTLDLYFRKLMQRAAEVVAELCLRRLQLPGDTADQVWTVMKRCVAQRTEMLKDRHLHHVVLCSTYSVCKVNSVTPEVTFKRIIEQYKQLSSTGGGSLNGGVGTPRLSVIKDILLQANPDGREQDRGDIIRFYNKVYIPAMKQFVLEFKNLVGQQRGAASVSTAKDAVRVAKRALTRNSSRDGPPRHPGSSTATTPTGKKHDEQGRWKRGATGDGSTATSAVDPESAQAAPPRSSGRTTRSSEQGKKDADNDENDYGEGAVAAAPAAADTGPDEGDDVVAAGAALSALSSAPHPHTPLVSPLPSQRMASPKRVQDNVYLTTVTSPARGAGPARGFSRPLPPATGHPRGSAGGGGRKSGGSGSGGVGVGVGVITGGAVYAFGESHSKDLAMINSTVGDDGLAHPPSAKKARGSPAPATRTPR